MDVDYFGEYFPESSYACGFVERDYGILRYTGEDALDLLNRMSTNALMELPQHERTRMDRSLHNYGRC